MFAREALQLDTRGRACDDRIAVAARINGSLMRRLHLFEFEDQPWFPALLRDLLTEQLQFELEARRVYQPIVPHLARALRRTGRTHLVDLCSGAGGPVLGVRAALEEQLGEPVTVELTDRFPNHDAFARARERAPGRIDSCGAPIDARAVPGDRAGFRTLFSAFHHFRPTAAQAILQDAVDSGAPIGVFEFTSRAPRAPLAMARAALRVWARTPLDLPRTPTRLLLSFVVPLVPWIYFVDASVSHWRTYTPDELRAMTTRLGGQRYRWECGRARGVTFLIGTPTGP
ncbi:MAG: hypothetical protein KC636_01090 [Myxococcales bacterium]|nr:hypothetical protein [Myxococcales bacterium]